MSEVDERQGLLNVVTLLPTRVPDTLPAVVFSKIDRGRYRVESDYSPRVVTLLKSTLPAAVRRWRDNNKCWEVSADWAGPLVGALRNAGVEVVGLGEFEEADLFWWCLSPVPISKGGHHAYLKGFCASCTQSPHRLGGLECDPCYRKRVLRQHRVRAALAAAGLAPYQRAVPSAGSAARFRVPVWADDGESATARLGPAVGHAEVVDAVILAARVAVDRPPCPICERRPAKGAVVHVACRRRLLHALLGKPFVKARNAAFQADLCTVCLSRPTHRHGAITCEHCHHLETEVRSAQQDGSGQ
jgi:hypothetical protein